MVGKRSLANPRDPKNNEARDGDLETGFARKRPKQGFKDAVDMVMASRTTAVLKKQLQSGVDRDEFEKYRKNEDEIKEIKNKKIRKYYEAQNDRLNDWLEVDTIVKAMADSIFDSMNPDADHDGHREGGGGLQDVEERIEELLPDDERSRRAKADRNARWAINVNVVVNIVLLIAKGVAATQSSSLSLIASLLDSALDLLCTGIVFATNKIVAWRLSSLERRFPVGRRRLEPLGILVFSIIMVISFAQILQESVQKLLPSGDHSMATLGGAAIGAMAATVGVKGFIGIFCSRVKTTQVQALAQDCKTDVIFNTLSLLFPVIGKAANIWWLDSAGAGVLSLFIIYDWGETCFENVTRLCGRSVEDVLLKKLTFLAYRFSPLVLGFKTITAYHAGDGIWVEFDLIMDEKTPLRRVHDVSETLQYCAEALDEVDRAFVTVDYSAENPGGHASDHQ